MKKQNSNIKDAEVDTQLQYKIRSAETRNNDKLFKQRVDEILGGSNPKVSIPKKSTQSSAFASYF